MLILAIDTSGQSGGITLAEADAGSFRVIESAAIAGGTFSAQLIPTLAALLKKHGYGVKDLRRICRGFRPRIIYRAARRTERDQRAGGNLA